MSKVPGGKTGLLSVVKRKPLIVEVDTALLRELRAHEQQAAQELGQWQPESQVAHGTQIQLVVFSAAGGEPEILQQPAIDASVDYTVDSL
jgi:hypothetical protein